MDYQSSQPQPAPKPVNPKLAFWTSAPGIISMVAIAAVVAMVGGLVLTLIEGSAARDLDVTLAGCQQRSGSKTVAVAYTVHNTGEKTRDARVTIEFQNSSGAEVDTDTDTVRNVSPGATVRGEKLVDLDASTPGVRCVITNVR